MGEYRESLDGLAFQYVAGELDASAEAAFEERLLVDLAACEAVAAAQRALTLVQLTRTGVASQTPGPRGVRRGQAFSIRWVAASLLVAGLLGLMMVGRSLEWRPLNWPSLAWHADESRPVGSDLDVAMVVAWTAGAEALEEGAVPEEVELVSQGSSELDVPGWLVTALEHAEANEDEAMEN